MKCVYRSVIERSPITDSFPIPTYLFLKAIKDWGGMRRGLQGREGGLPLIKCGLVKTALGATGNEPGPTIQVV